MQIQTFLQNIFPEEKKTNRSINRLKKIISHAMFYILNLKKRLSVVAYVQGGPNQNPLPHNAVPLELCISDPMLVKPKCVREAVVFFNFRKFVYIFNCLFTI